MITSGFQLFCIKRYDQESYDDYMERSYFILNNIRKGQYTYEELVEKSYFFYCIQKLGCKYHPKIMEEIKNMAEYAGLEFLK